MCKITPHSGFTYSSVFSVSVVASCTAKKPQEQHNTVHSHASLLHLVDIAATTQYKLMDLMSQLLLHIYLQLMFPCWVLMCFTGAEASHLPRLALLNSPIAVYSLFSECCVPYVSSSSDAQWCYEFECRYNGLACWVHWFSWHLLINTKHKLSTAEADGYPVIAVFVLATLPSSF